jgi:hypothetical protein
LFTTGNIISIYLGNGDGTFHAGLIQAMDSTTNPYPIGLGDFNGDGRLDLAAVSRDDNTVSILLQKTAQPGVLVTLASGESPILVGQPVTYTAVVWASPVTPTGSVTFKLGAQILGTVPLTNGLASFTTTFMKVGKLPIVGSYSGDQNYRAKNSKAVTQVVNKCGTATSTSSNPNPSVHGHPVTFTASVSSSGPPPTGRVVFNNGNSSIGSSNVVNGVATLTTSHLPSGSLSITATYEGDAECEKSTSPVLVQTVN